MNTSDTYAQLCVSEYSCRNRLCTLEALPGVISTGPNSASFPEQLPRLEKRGETTINSQWTESIQMAQDTIFEECLQPEKIQHSFIPSHVRDDEKDLRNWTKVRSRRGTNYEGQSKLLHQ